MTSWATVALLGVPTGITATASIVVAAMQKSSTREQVRAALDQANADRIDRHQSQASSRLAKLPTLRVAGSSPVVRFQQTA